MGAMATVFKAVLGELLIPEIESRGFTRSKGALGQSSSSFPFGQYRREFQGGAHLLEIQVDKYRNAAFRINLGVVPSEGILHRAGRVPSEEVSVHYLDNYWVLYRCPMFRVWFYPNFASWRRVDDSDFRKLVRRVIKLMPEVEGVFSGGRQMPHIRTVRCLT